LERLWTALKWLRITQKWSLNGKSINGCFLWWYADDMVIVLDIFWYICLL
jgi:hypothetical protein